jgi:phage I-like protein
MNLTILNRELKHPADGWYHIEPKGEHAGTADDGTKISEVIDAKAVESIVSTFNREVEDYETKYGAPFPGMLLDREHFSHNEEKETAADGWVKALQNRSGETYAKIDWTPRGKAAVDGGEYKFFSTEYPPDGIEILNKKGDRLRVRPLKLSGLSLTNRPNNVGGRPITNRKLSPDQPATHPAGVQADTQKIKMEKIAKKLGLSAEASEDAIYDKISELLDQLKKNNKAEEENTGLKNRLTEIEGEQIAAELTAAGITDEATVTELKPYLGTLKNREARTSFLARLTPKKAEPAKTPLTVLNRAKTPGGTQEAEGGEPTKADNVRAIRISNRAAELRGKDNRISLNAAYSQATGQIDAEIAAGK